MLEHVRFLLLPDGRVVVVLISAGGEARDKVLRPEHEFTQAELDRTADYLNRHYGGWTLRPFALTCWPSWLPKRNGTTSSCLQHWSFAIRRCSTADRGRQVYVEGAAQFASTPELAGAEAMRELLAAIEEKTKLVTLLNACIDAPEPVHVQIGVKEINGAGEHLSLITAPYLVRDQGQGSLGVLGRCAWNTNGQLPPLPIWRERSARRSAAANTLACCLLHLKI